MAGKNDYTWDEVAAMIDRVERKLELVMEKLGFFDTFYDFDCSKLLTCSLAGKHCKLCKRMGNGNARRF